MSILLDAALATALAFAPLVLVCTSQRSQAESEYWRRWVNKIEWERRSDKA